MVPGLERVLMRPQSRTLQSALQEVRSLPLLSAAKVKSRVNLLAYVSKFVKLRKRGGNWFGICPFHRERHPSFGVRADRQLWFCFGCQRGGDLFNFEMLRTGCSFAEAVRQVARNAGLLSVCAAGNAGLVYGRAFPKGHRPKACADDCFPEDSKGRSPLVIVPGGRGGAPRGQH